MGDPHPPFRERCAEGDVLTQPWSSFQELLRRLNACQKKFFGNISQRQSVSTLGGLKTGLLA